MASSLYKDCDPLPQLNNKMTVLLVLSIFFMLFFVYELASNHKHDHHVFNFFWIVVSLGNISYCLFNLKIIKRLQNTTIPVKENIEKDVSMLENGLKILDLSSDIFLVVSILVLETMILLHHLGRYNWHSYSLDDWSSMPFLVRAILYLSISALIYFRRKHPGKMDFRQHIAHLRELVNKM